MTDAFSSKNIFKLSKFTTYLGDDGIMRTTVIDHAEVQFLDALENTRTIESLYTGKNFPLLIDSRKIKSISKDARDHFSMRGRKSVVSCFAILVSSPLSRIIGNFFMGLNKPSVPARLFDNEEKAVQWLKKTSKQL